MDRKAQLESWISSLYWNPSNLTLLNLTTCVIGAARLTLLARCLDECAREGGIMESKSLIQVRAKLHNLRMLSCSLRKRVAMTVSQLAAYACHLLRACQKTSIYIQRIYLFSHPSVRQVQNHFRQVVKMCDERCRRNGQMQHSKVSKGAVDLSKVPSLEKVRPSSSHIVPC